MYYGYLCEFYLKIAMIKEQNLLRSLEIESPLFVNDALKN